MASQSLYRKWRSQTFSDLIGQEAVTRTLLNAMREGSLAHAYLFCGPRGTGKTSAARLLAKSINCANPKDGEPCNECDSCREITEGRSPDVIEMDAASNTGIDNIRELRENAAVMSAGGRYKVYVLDECQMLSTAAFNALLKTLEEPPPRVIFVLATTDPQKVLPTVVSRCQRFDFRRFGLRDIISRLDQVARGEGLELEAAAAELLARAAQGGMRDALSLLDQAVAFSGTRIDLERARAMLGLADVTALRRLIVCVADDQAAEGLEIINDLVVGGADLRQLNSQLGEEWRALMLARAGGDLIKLMEYGAEQASELGALAERFSLEQLMACARAFTRNDGPARGLPVPQLALELSFLECVSIQRGVTLAVSASAPQAITQSQSTPIPRALQPGPAPTMIEPTPMLAALPSQPASYEELDLAAIDAGNAEPPAHPTVRPGTTEPSPQPVAPAAATPAMTDASVVGDTDNVGGDQGLVDEARRQWQLIRKICKQKTGVGSTVFGLLNDAEPQRIEPGSPPVLIIVARHEFHFKSLREDSKREVVEWALAQALNVQIRVRFILGAEPQPRMAATPERRAPAPSRVVDAPSTASSATPMRENGASYRSEPPRGAAPSAPGSNANDYAARSLGPSIERRAPDSAAPARPAPSDLAGAPTSTPALGNLEQAVRSDPVVMEFMRHGLDLAEVRPLASLDDADTAR
jgi:DNA polymerase-3 subunit gamma/tau